MCGNVSTFGLVMDAARRWRAEPQSMHVAGCLRCDEPFVMFVPPFGPAPSADFEDAFADRLHAACAFAVAFDALDGEYTEGLAALERKAYGHAA